MDRLDRYFGVHGQALALRSERMGVLASNIANAATPGFKARDLDFAAVLKPAGGPTMTATHARHYPAAGGAPRGKELLYRQPVQPSLDGNTVELATEQLQFTENALRYRSTLSILNGRIQTLTSAMKGE
ncbi:MAG: flagellar basal body rod protein FlgB [Sphingomonadaceae bacterium]